MAATLGAKTHLSYSFIATIIPNIARIQVIKYIHMSQ